MLLIPFPGAPETFSKLYTRFIPQRLLRKTDVGQGIADIPLPRRLIIRYDFPARQFSPIGAPLR